MKLCKRLYVLPPFQTFLQVSVVSVFLTCVVMSQPSSRLSRTDDPLSRSSTRNSASCRILCSCRTQTYVHVNICTTINCSHWHTVRERLSEILDKCTVGHFPASTHLLDPLRVLQNFKEGVFRVGGGGAGSAGSQQLFERGFNLSCFCKLHRHQFTVQTRVQSKALCGRDTSTPHIHFYSVLF